MTATSKPTYKVCIQDKKLCRQEEIGYCEQIYKEYIKKESQQHLIRRMFQSLHSDWLNIEETILEHNNAKIPMLKSKTKFQTRDILLQIRGSIINKNKLKQLAHQKIQVKNLLSQVNCLLWGQNQLEVLVPKGLSRVLMDGTPELISFLQNNQHLKNCFIEYQFGAKYLISASKQILPGELLILDIDSLKRYQFHHETL